MGKYRTETQILEDISKIVLDVRSSLGERYDVGRDSPYADYSGLCDMASAMVSSYVEKYAKQCEIPVEITTLHGEQRHTPKLKSEYWALQHTWVVVKFENFHVYVDPTSGQFKRFYPDIPDFYVSTKPPKWFYPDAKNPAWNGFTLKLNEKIWITHNRMTPYGVRPVSDGVVEYCQYEIWGRISDLLRRISRTTLVVKLGRTVMIWLRIFPNA